MDKGPEPMWKLDELVRSEVLKEISPTPEERTLIIDTSKELLKASLEAISSMGLEDVEPMLAGSVAKGTMSKDPDIDLFILFSCDVPDEEMERYGMEIGRRILEHPKKKYTQHPYLTGDYKGFSCDIVPCFSISKGSKVRTAVDRTPHHTRYINSKLRPEQRDDVLLLKSFLKSFGAYGAEDTVNGFSGYLVELLILEFGSFAGVMDRFSNLEFDLRSSKRSERISENERRGIPRISIALRCKGLMDEKPLEDDEYEKMFQGDTFIFIDPVDPRRNVGSPVSEQTLNLVSKAAKELLSEPSGRSFLPNGKRPHIPKGINVGPPENVELFTLELPEGDPGIVITQLRRSLRKLRNELVRKGFEKVEIFHLLQFPALSEIEQSYLRARYVWTGDIPSPRIIFSLRTEPNILDIEFKHWGPPADNKRMKDFKEKHGGSVQVDGPSNRSYVILEREEVNPDRLTELIWDSIHHGSRFEESRLKSSKNEAFSMDFLDELSIH